MIVPIKPKVSVFVVTYNHEKYLSECLQSVVEQVCNFDFEVVIAEDCSTDSTRIIIEEYLMNYPMLIKPIYNSSNVGLHRNIINSINKCDGEYIAYLDGDDYLLPGKLQKQVDFFVKYNECVMVFHNTKMVGSAINYITYNNKRSKKMSVVEINTFVENGLAHWCTSSKMFKKNALPEEGLLDQLKCIGDQHFNLQVASRGKVGYMPDVLSCYRKHEDGISQRNKAKSKIECTTRDLELTYNSAQIDYGVKKDIVNRRLAFTFYDAACQFLMIKDYEKFRRYIVRSYENNIFFNIKHKICFSLKIFPQILYILKTINNYLYDIRGKQRI